MSLSPARTRLLLLAGFLIGVALMGLQMLISRPLAANFGSDIVVWSTLISTTMFAMMAGYYAGGVLADRTGSSVLLGMAVLVAAVYFAAVPPLLQAPLLPGAVFTDEAGNALSGGPRTVLGFLSDVEEIASPALGAILASMLLVFVPFGLMSMFSPFCVRLLLQDAVQGGRTVGSVYAITTFGNIIGALGTTFVLMPHLPVSRIVLAYAVLLAVCGLVLMALRIRPHAEPSQAGASAPNAG